MNLILSESLSDKIRRRRVSVGTAKFIQNTVIGILMLTFVYFTASDKPGPANVKTSKPVDRVSLRGMSMYHRGNQYPRGEQVVDSLEGIKL
jgi:hypothetical protein